MTSRSTSLSGTTVAITGGARGIGRATAQRFLAAGAHVVIGDLDLEFAQRTAGELTAARAGAGWVTAAELDVTDDASFTRFLDALPDLDVLVNNAGIMPTGAFADESPEMTDRILAINLRAVIVGSRLALNNFRVRGSGHIVNIASLVGELAVPALATYSASKAGVIHFTESLELELAGTGIRATVILPSLIRTELSAGAKPAGWVGPLITADPADVAAAIVTAVAHRHTGRIAVPRHVGALIKTLSALPGPARRALSGAAGLESAFADADPAQREIYNRRIAKS